MAGPQVTISKADGSWVVRADGAVLAESKNALVSTEGEYPAVIYFQQNDIAMEFLDGSDLKTCALIKVRPAIMPSQVKAIDWKTPLGLMKPHRNI